MGKTRITKKQGIKWRPTITKGKSKKDKGKTYHCVVCGIKIPYARVQRFDKLCKRCWGE
jgi:RNA polymerase-binding transcription factor DksA